ncbi:MAG: SGNH/GDSL hydrolase family protein [Prevotellaceae bacterium]|nr:SGNH/GDSL hydrolase family protein [Candidatus Faecinaster equi]
MDLMFENPNTGANENFLYQWDQNVQMLVELKNVDSAEAVFWTDDMDEGVRVDLTYTPHGYTCIVPDILTQKGVLINVSITYKNNGRKTVNPPIAVPVIRQAKPEGWVSSFQPEYVSITTAYMQALQVIDRVEGIKQEIETKGITTKASIPDEYTELAGKVENLSDLNCIDILSKYRASNKSKDGITFTVNLDGSVRVSGIAEAQVFCNYYYSLEKLPDRILNGNVYTLIHESDNVRVEIWFYKNGTYLKGSSYRQNVNIEIPKDANGMLIRLRVDAGLTVGEDVKPMLLNTMSNSELANIIKNIDKSALLYKGSLENDFNIDEDFETGIYLLEGNTFAPTGIGNLINIRNSNTIRTQIFFRFTGLNIYYRRFASGSWSEWENTKYNFGELFPLRQKKYLAFGDSLTFGALWNDATPTITQASYGSRIPDRIANAVNCKEYVNYGVGGMGFVQKSTSNPDTILDHMKKQNIKDASLITVMAGRNDGNIQLGTKDSVEADGTICGALKEVINYIRNQNKTCQIVIIQTTPNTSSNNPFGARSNVGWTLNDVDREFSEICKTMNVGYASWYGCSLLSSWSDLSGGGGNYSHMRTDEGYEQMGNFIAGQVCKFYQN